MAGFELYNKFLKITENNDIKFGAALLTRKTDEFQKVFNSVSGFWTNPLY